MKIAIVHEWLIAYAGSERVLEQMLYCLPNADLFSVVDFLAEEHRGFLGGRQVVTSILQRVPFGRKIHRYLLPIMPFAVEQFDLSGYDLVISSSHAVAKGVLTGPDQLHICMCYSPMRYAWDLQHQYLQETGFDRGIRGYFARWLLHRMRIWDSRTANGVDEFIAISEFIKRRIWKVYRRTATVIYPPVDVEFFTPGQQREEFYLTASRMVPYKKIGLIVEAFSDMPERKLVVVGDGPEFGRIKRMARENVELLGYQTADALRDLLRRAKAFVFAAEEDFGIAPLEAQACGTPVIAYAKGGSLETIVGLGAPQPTGVLFFNQSKEAISDAVRRFESDTHQFSREACRANALRFSYEAFRGAFKNFVFQKEKEYLNTEEVLRQEGTDSQPLRYRGH